MSRGLFRLRYHRGMSGAGGVLFLAVLAVVAIALIVFLPVLPLLGRMMHDRDLKRREAERERVRSEREREGLCAGCGYDRRGLAVDAACPECGSKP